MPPPTAAETGYQPIHRFLPRSGRLVVTAIDFFRGRSELSPRPFISSMADTGCHHGQSTLPRKERPATTTFDFFYGRSGLSPRPFISSTEETSCHHGNFRNPQPEIPAGVGFQLPFRRRFPLSRRESELLHSGTAQSRRFRARHLLRPKSIQQGQLIVQTLLDR